MKALKKTNNKNPEQVAFIKAYALILVLATALSGGLGWVLYDSLIVQPESQEIKATAAKHSREHADTVHQYLTKVSGNLARFGQRPNVAEALLGHNETVLNKFQLVLKRAFPDALNIRFIPADKEAREASLKSKLLFTELDMINRALEKDIVLPEAIKLNKVWALNLITPLTDPKDEGVAVGVIMMSIPLTKLSETLAALNTDTGQTSVLQTFSGGQPIKILSVGTSDFDHPGQVSKIDGSYWSVRFKPSAQLANEAARSPSLLFIGIGLLFVLCAGGGWKFAHKLAKQHTQKRSASVKSARSKADGEVSDIASPMYQNQNILDVNVQDEDKDILGLNETAVSEGDATAQNSDDSASATKVSDINDVIFRSYDIRGVVGEQLSFELAEKIGKAVGSEALDHGEKWIIVARDARIHSPQLCEQLINGIRSTGCGVVNIGTVPTPLMHFATHELDASASGVMVTASHNSAEYNGFKIVINGNTLADDSIQQLRSRIVRGDYHRGQGEEQAHNIVPDYIDKIFSDVALAGEITIVVDAANAVAGEVAPLLLEELGCEVIPLHCEIDGNFPNHNPDPTQLENLQDLIEKVKETEADLGVAYDGDGDRLVVVTPQGDIIWPDRLLMLFAKDIVTRNPGADVIFDVKCTRQLNNLISSYGGRPIMWKSGHAHMKAKMIETGALLGGELSGHIFIKDRWFGFDDAIYATSRLLEIITLRDQDLDTIFEDLPELPNTPEIIVPIDEDKKFSFIKQLVAQGNFENGKITTIDGLRVDFASSWGLVRASNTGPALTLRFEGDSDEALAEVQAIVKREVSKVDGTLELPF